MSGGKKIQDLPIEILVDIFSYLDVEDLSLNIRNVCISWRKIVQDSRIWKSLKYNPSKGMTGEENIIKVLKGAPSLQKPMPWYLYSKKILEVISEYCKEVRELYILQATDSLLQKVVKECAQLEYLELDYYKFENSNCLNIISNCNNLKHLKLSGCGSYYEVKLFHALADGCPSLESLNIQYLNHYTTADFLYFLKVKGSKLRALTLCCCFFREMKCVIALINDFCTGLEELTIDSHGRYKSFNLHTEFVWGTTIFTTYFESDHVQNLKKLQLFSFGNFDKKLAFAMFENCNKLESLYFSKVIGLTDECLEPIFLLKFLNSLKCEYCSLITDKGVSHIVRCSSLKILSLLGCENLTSKSFVMCCTELNLLKRLVLDVPTLDIQDVYQVPNLLKNLNYLHISRVGLEDKVPRYFKRCMPNLELVM